MNAVPSRMSSDTHRPTIMEQSMGNTTLFRMRIFNIPRADKLTADVEKSLHSHILQSPK